MMRSDRITSTTGTQEPEQPEPVAHNVVGQAPRRACRPNSSPAARPQPARGSTARRSDQSRQYMKYDTNGHADEQREKQQREAVNPPLRVAQSLDLGLGSPRRFLLRCRYSRDRPERSFLLVFHLCPGGYATADNRTFRPSGLSPTLRRPRIFPVNVPDACEPHRTDGLFRTSHFLSSPAPCSTPRIRETSEIGTRSLSPKQETALHRRPTAASPDGFRRRNAPPTRNASSALPRSWRPAAAGKLRRHWS